MKANFLGNLKKKNPPKAVYFMLYLSRLGTVDGSVTDASRRNEELILSERIKSFLAVRLRVINGLFIYFYFFLFSYFYSFFFLRCW